MAGEMINFQPQVRVLLISSSAGYLLIYCFIIGNDSHDREW